MSHSVGGGTTMAANVTNHTHSVIDMTMKLGSLFSGVLGRIRAFDGMIDQNAQHALGGADFDGANPYIGRTSAPPPPAFVPLPGPWRFMTSGYALALMAMAILLNRIQNIVVPPRQPLAYRLSRQIRNQQTSRIRWIYYSILPLDFSSTFCRLVFRVPSIYFLSKALLLWIVILFQTANIFPSWQWRWLIELGDWAAHKDMESVCWFSFCAVCGALCVGALTRGLEGTGGSANTSPFNLFGYAFILHIYSSPMTHATKAPDMASRPDKHVIFTMIMPLLQLTMIHMLGVKQRWSHQRLIPTAITSIISLTHFHTVLWFSPASYPLLNYMPCLFESGLALVTLLAIGLNALTQLLLEGTITRPLFGHQATLLPKWDEDFSIVLLRLGTASLEATSVAGFGNEVGGVAVSDTKDFSKAHIEYGSVEMNRYGITSITNTTEGRGRKRKAKAGFANEIKSVKASTSEGELWINAAWFRELARFGDGVAKFLKGLCLLLWNRLRGRKWHTDRAAVIPARERDGSLDRRSADTSDEDQPDDYDRFLQGENVSDDDEDFEPQQRSRTGSASGTPSTTSDNDDDAETVGLYADLSAAASTSTSAPLLLAHMTDTSSSPLTRRRYSRLVGGEGARSPERDSIFDDWSKIISDRRSMFGSADDNDGLDETRRNCVICTVEPRQVICWPCRCLALCDDCRENLATRSSASKHICPCCRRSVEGYSKIFIP